MRFIASLTILLLATFTSTLANAPITSTTSKFFQGDWYSIETNPSNIGNANCCVPLGKITFGSAYSKLSMKATRWSGALCREVYLTNSYSDFDINKFPADGTYAKMASGNYFTDDFISVTAKNLDIESIFSNNGTQKVAFDLHLNYKLANSKKGENCIVTLSKAKTPVVA